MICGVPISCKDYIKMKFEEIVKEPPLLFSGILEFFILLSNII